MDVTKDIQKKDTVTKLLGNQTPRTSPFGENISGERAYRRSEKIGAAVFLLTNHLSVSDNLSIEARRAATGLLSSVLSIRDELRSSGSQHVRDFQASARYLISIVRMLAVAGHVSMQNADIVCEAIDDLGAFVQSANRTVLSENIRLARDEFLDVRFGTATYEKVSHVEKDIRKTVVPESESDNRAEIVLDDQPTASSDVRAASIIEILRTGGEWGIRDIAAHLPEYSEKMVQRELAALVVANRVKKSGAKRWSRYALV
jgi:hypothetical protein